MSKYTAPSTSPRATRDFQLWLVNELRGVSDALSAVETDLWLLKEWNAEPAKLYDGMLVFADGTNWNPGSGRGFYGYYGATWHYLG